MLRQPGFHDGGAEQWQPTVREEILTYMLRIADIIAAGKITSADSERVAETQSKLLAETNDTYSYLKGLMKHDFLDKDAFLQFLEEQSEHDAIAMRIKEQMPKWINVSDNPDPDSSFRIGGPYPQNIAEKKDIITRHIEKMGARPGSQHYDAFIRGLDNEILGLSPVEGSGKSPIYIGTQIIEYIMSDKQFNDPVRVIRLEGFDTINGEQGLIITIEPVDAKTGGISSIRPNEILKVAV